MLYYPESFLLPQSVEVERQLLLKLRWPPAAVSAIGGRAGGGEPGTPRFPSYTLRPPPSGYVQF